MENVYSFTAAVRGYHHYRKFWKPKENETLKCLYEENNPYDHFAIKTLSSDGKIVGHLPREISRVTKFFLDRGANISVKLTSRHYRRSPLVQGGMEIACLVTAKIPATLKNSKLGEKYLELVKSKYTEPKNEEILGCFVTEAEETENPFRNENQIRRWNRSTVRNGPPPKKLSKQTDIRKMFAPTGRTLSSKRSGPKNPEVIELD